MTTKITNNREHLIQFGAVKLAPGANAVPAAGMATIEKDYAQGFARMIEAGWITVDKPANRPTRETLIKPAAKPASEPASKLASGPESKLASDRLEGLINGK